MLLRVLTALGVIGLCCFAAWRGGEVIGFVIATDPAGAVPGSVARLQSWTQVPGIASAAREALLAADGSSIDALIELLASRPLDSIDWLSLAGKRLEMGAPRNQVLSALMMSRVSGPNEEEVMLRRALVGVLRWEVLPPEIHGQTVHDLAGVFEQGVVEPQVALLVKSVIAAKSEEIRATLSERLRAEQMSTAKLAQIGL